MKWPDQTEISAAAVQQLLSFVDLGEFRDRMKINEPQLASWRADGVPPGPYSAMVRSFAEANGLPLTKVLATKRCALCDAASELEYAGVPLCSYCRSKPRVAGERLGFEFAGGQRDNGVTVWIGIRSPKSFEFPFAARLTRQQGTWFAKPDPEVGHPEFDDAVHIETQDYEALFDAFQHPRRRLLARGIAEAVELQINVDSVYALFPATRQVHRGPLVLSLLLLTWSLANEIAPHR